MRSGREDSDDFKAFLQDGWNGSSGSLRSLTLNTEAAEVAAWAGQAPEELTRRDRKVTVMERRSEALWEARPV